LSLRKRKITWSPSPHC